MSEDFEQSPPAPAPEEKPVDPDLLESAKVAIAARGKSTRRMIAMDYPANVYNELVERLADRRHQTDDTFEWLCAECYAKGLDAPSRSSLYRFSSLVREEYRLAELKKDNDESMTYWREAAKGDPDAMQMALNMRLTQLLTGELLRARDGEAIDTKRLMALMMGARTVAQTAFDKQKMDVRISALEKAIEKANREIALKDQRLAKLPDQVKAIEGKLAQVEQAQAQGKKVDATVYAAIRAELTRVRDTAGGAAA
jgi:hypothetical protein